LFTNNIGRGGGGYRGSNYREDYRPPGRRDERPRGGGGYRGERPSYDDRRGGYSSRHRSRSRSRSPEYRRRSRSRSPGYARDRDYRSSRRDEYRPSSSRKVSVCTSLSCVFVCLK